MKKYYFSLLSILLYTLQINAQVLGCTDPLSNNYNPEATVNDGSCMYDNAVIVPQASLLLEDSVKETSGIIAWNNNLYTHNDDTDTGIYALNAETGVIDGIHHLSETVNVDWEEITQDDEYIYLGDFGNNANGNRNDLRIVRVGKEGLLAGNTSSDLIEFTYPDQTDFTAKGGNNTNFDCEAFIVGQDSIYLFTKRWIDNKTSVYALPKTPGSHVAEFKGMYNVNGLITGATYLEDKKLIVLCGYNTVLQPFLYLLYDFEGHEFFSGNKRKIATSMFLHQTEGITTTDGMHYYVTNERFAQSPAITIPQKLHTYDLTPYLEPHIQSLALAADVHEVIDTSLKIYPNPARDTINVRVQDVTSDNAYYITDMTGKTVLSGNLDSALNKINVTALKGGMYIITTNNYNTPPFKFIKL